jgi:hypothetical protein
MILPVMVAVWLAALALGAAVPVALAAARLGRVHGWEQAAIVAAEGALAEAEGGGWLAAAVAVPLGGRMGIPALGAGRVSVVREVHRIDGGLWLVVSSARVIGSSGGQLAAAERGLLVRVVPDSALPLGRIVASARPSFRRPE